MSTRSLAGLDLTGLAVSCPDTIEYSRNPDQTPHTQLHVQGRAYHNMCMCALVCAHIGSKEPKGPKANKEQGEGSSRKLTSHFIRLALSVLVQTAGSRGRDEVKIKGCSLGLIQSERGKGERAGGRFRFKEKQNKRSDNFQYLD